MRIIRRYYSIIFLFVNIIPRYRRLSGSLRSVSVKETSITSKASIQWELTQSKQSASYGFIHRLQFFFQRTG